MTIPALPALDRASATFKTDVDNFFATQLPAFSVAIEPEIERINAIGYGSYNATSATSLTIGTGSKSLTVETGKGFVVGQTLIVASTASPTNYMTGQVTSYNSGTGALVVNVTATGGSGTLAAWTVSVTALVAGGGVSPDSTVVLTTGTSWTCPAGVTRAVLTVVGGCGGGGDITSSGGGGGGGAGGFSQNIVTLVPGTSYTYAIGAAGSAGVAGLDAGTGGTGGTSTFTVGANTYTGGGGSGGGGSTTVTAGAGGIGGNGSGPGFIGSGDAGQNGDSGANYRAGYGAVSILGTKGGDGGDGGAGGGDGGAAGSAGRIVLELYK